MHPINSAILVYNKEQESSKRIILNLIETEFFISLVGNKSIYVMKC